MEALRQGIRRRLGYRSALYRAASRMYTEGMTIVREGFGVNARLRRLRASAGPDGPPQAVRFRTLNHPLYLRPGTQDIGAALNNIVRREYGRYPPRRAPSVMVDAGAYIGDTSAYFLSRYPGLKVYALEPNPVSLALAQQNLAPYGQRARLIPVALCGADGMVRIAGRETGARISGSGGLAVRAVSIAGLLTEIGKDAVDILKLDIEGAEDDIFARDISEWLPKFGMIIAETHGPEITERMRSALQRHRWSCTAYRNLHYCFPPDR